MLVEMCEYRFNKANIGFTMFDTRLSALLELGVPKRTPAHLFPTRFEGLEGPGLLPIMNELLNQLGGHVLGSVPTMIFFILLVLAYGVLVRRPLDRVLAERRARTTGAVEQAREAIAAAEAETVVYEDKLRRAKADVFAAREQRLKQWDAERDAALGQARAATAETVKGAKAEIERSVVVARQQIEGMSAELSEQIMRAVMPAGTRPGAAQ
jgi:F-type H+-transporting ATPase subunit b